MYHCDSIPSMSPARSFPRPRLPDHSRFALSAATHSPPNLVPQVILPPARFTALPSAYARLFPGWSSASPPDRHTDTCAPPRKVHLICAPLPPHCRAASCKSPGCSGAIICVGRYRDPCCAAHSAHRARRRSIVVNLPESGRWRIILDIVRFVESILGSL
jgi:hypothetical protein